MPIPTQYSLFKTGLTYLGGGIVGRLVPFILLPILTRYLSPSDYGMVATFQSALFLSFAFIGLNTNGAIVRNYADLSKQEFGVYIFNCILILLFSILIVLLFLLPFREYAISISNLSLPWILAIPVVSAGLFLFNTALSVFRVKGLALQFTSGNLLLTSFNFLVTIILVVWMSMDWRGRAWGISSANIIFGIIGVCFLLMTGYIKPHFNKTYFKDALLFGSPLILHKIASWIATMLNRPLLNEYSGLEATGIFFVGCTIASAVTVFEGSFEQAWTPWLYQKLKENTVNARKKIVQITYLYFLGLTIIVLVLTVLAHYILPVFLGEQYTAAANFIFLPAMAYAFNGMRKGVFGYILYKKKSYLIAIITFVTSASGIALNYFWIKSYGVTGASYAMVVTFLIGFLLTWGVAQKILPMPWLLYRGDCI